MPYSQKLYERLKQYFANTPNVEEKKMFSGIAFMVNGKICVTVGPERIMCRIDPELHDEAIKKKGARTVQMRGRDYKGYVHVAEDAVSTKKELDIWISSRSILMKEQKLLPKKENRNYEIILH